MLNVFITVDTELWPQSAGWPQRPVPAGRRAFDAEIALYLDGRTAQGDFGIGYQLATLNRHGLKASFFVEALCAGRIGGAVLEQLVRQVQGAGHDVQLHLHPEWLGDLNDPTIPRRVAQYMHEFSFSEQVALLRRGAANLHAAGAAPLRAFRAGSFGANTDTLRALAECGIAFDSSYSPTFLQPDWQAMAPLEQPCNWHGVIELPVSSFRDYPGHRRHAQLCACSFGEMRNALLSAYDAGWYSFVILLHSAELIKHRGVPGSAAADRLVIGRFEQLCTFLAAHPRKFSTRLFSDLDPGDVPHAPAAPALHSPLRNTVLRVAEQAWSRRAS